MRSPHEAGRRRGGFATGIRWRPPLRCSGARRRAWPSCIGRASDSAHEFFGLIFAYTSPTAPTGREQGWPGIIGQKLEAMDRMEKGLISGRPTAIEAALPVGHAFVTAAARDCVLHRPTNSAPRIWEGSVRRVVALIARAIMPAPHRSRIERKRGGACAMGKVRAMFGRCRGRAPLWGTWPRATARPEAEAARHHEGMVLAAAERAGPAGRDPNPAMLGVARAKASGIDWHEGRAETFLFRGHHLRRRG
jgi:hypothetical protein